MKAANIVAAITVMIPIVNKTIEMRHAKCVDAALIKPTRRSGFSLSDVTTQLSLKYDQDASIVLIARRAHHRTTQFHLEQEAIADIPEW